MFSVMDTLNSNQQCLAAVLITESRYGKRSDKSNKSDYNCLTLPHTPLHDHHRIILDRIKRAHTNMLCHRKVSYHSWSSGEHVIQHRGEVSISYFDSGQLITQQLLHVPCVHVNMQRCPFLGNMTLLHDCCIFTSYECAAHCQIYK